MTNNKSQLALCGESTFSIDELDDEETHFDIMTNANLNSNILEIISSIKSDNFKYNYKDSITDIKQSSFEDQYRFVEKILQSIKEIYDFEFPLNIDITNLYDVNEIYDFLEFIEFDNTFFIRRIWKYLDQDLRTINISKFCLNNMTLIIKEVEEQTQSYDFNERVVLFLRTYDKNNFIQWFIRQTKNSKNEIIIDRITKKGETTYE